MILQATGVRPAWVRWRLPRNDADTIRFYGPVDGPHQVEVAGVWLPVPVTAFTWYADEPEHLDTPHVWRLTVREWVVAEIAPDNRAALAAAPDEGQWWRRMEWIDAPPPDSEARVKVRLDRLRGWTNGLPT